MNPPLPHGIPVYEDPTMPHRDEDGNDIHCRYIKLPESNMGRFFDLSSVKEYVICSAQFMAEMREKWGDKEPFGLVKVADDDL